MQNKSYLEIEFGPYDNKGADKIMEKLDILALEVTKHEQYGMIVDGSGRKTGNLPWRILVRAIFETREQAEDARRVIWPA